MISNQNTFNSENFRHEYFLEKRNVLFRLIELQSLVDRDSDGMEFTEDEKPKLDRLDALNTLLHHTIEDFENN